MSHYVLQKYRSNIKNHELEEFKNKLRGISEHLDTIILDLKSINYETAYISGGCAAWLIRRINEFDDIDIYVFSSTLNEDKKQKLVFMGYEKHGSHYGLDQNNFVVYKKFFLGFEYNLIFTPYDESHMMNMFDLDICANFINLKFPTNIIYSKNCLCTYDNYTTLIDLNKCYPLSLKDILNIVSRKVKPERAKKYLQRVNSYNNVELTILHYLNCKSCERRIFISKKYGNIWKIRIK